MGTITFNTLKYAQRLEKGGASRELAIAEAEALAEVLESGAGDLATKSDVTEGRTELRAEMRELRAELLGEIKLNRWMLAAVFGMVAANFAKQFF